MLPIEMELMGEGDGSEEYGVGLCIFPPSKMSYFIFLNIFLKFYNGKILN